MELMATCLDKLSKRLNAPIPEAIIGKMAVSIVKALDYLKDVQGIIHRDVKVYLRLKSFHTFICLNSAVEYATRLEWNNQGWLVDFTGVEMFA